MAYIIIPARFASTRFPGKPLALLAGEPLLTHVIRRARQAASVPVVVATDDDRIAKLAESEKAQVVMTPDTCRTGSDRVLAAAEALGLEDNEIVLNLQGDAPLTPVEAITNMLKAFDDENVHVATPCKLLSWDELDKLRGNKASTPFSGTTVLVDRNGDALWFSKNILPAIRKEADLRVASPLSPVHQHLGLYGYRLATLKAFSALREGVYEALEGLEQLRLLESGIRIRCVPLPHDAIIHGGIDTEDDLRRAEQLLLAA